MHLMIYVFYSWKFVLFDSLHSLPMLSMPYPLPLTTINLFSVSMSWVSCFVVCVLDFTYKWDHLVSVFLWFVSITPTSFIHAVANGKIAFFLWLNNIPLYKYHILYVHSYIHGYMDCFRIVAIVNNAVMNLSLWIFLWNSYFISFRYI